MTLPEAFAAKRKAKARTILLRREAWPTGIALSIEEDQSVLGVGLHRLMLVFFTPLTGEAVILWTPAGEDLRADDWEPA